MLCPFATHKLLPENDTQGRITPRVAILHSAVDAKGPTSLYHYFRRADVTLESHFFVTNVGAIEQYMDTEVRADANRAANAFAVSIETEDDGTPDQRPWTQEQLDAIDSLLRWLNTVHTIPLQVCDDPFGSGIGYHTMFGAPSAWTPVRKTCPGTVRKEQFRDVVMPRLTQPVAPLTLASTEMEVSETMKLVKTIHAVATGAHGEGHTPKPIDVPFATVVSVCPHAPHPPSQGYVNNGVPSYCERDGKLWVTVQKAAPNATAAFVVSRLVES